MIRIVLFGVAAAALAFGAVYPWGYWTLALILALAIAVGVRAQGPRSGARDTPLAMALAAIAAAAALQLVPLPRALIAAISPATHAALETISLPYATAAIRMHPLSLDPAATGTALALFVVFAALLLVLSRRLTAAGLRACADGLAATGALLALVALVQRPLYDGRIFGVWAPEHGETAPFGPFVNRNHFAGWMLMALPVCVACLGAALSADASRHRHWAAWLSSAQAGRVLALGLASFLMSLALVMTTSRSAIVALALTALLAVASLRRRPLVASSIAILIVVALAWTGTEVLAARFGTTAIHELALRRDAWADAVTIAGAFPLTGAGLNAYGTATLLYQRADPTHHYAEAHNDYLQLAAEGGVLLVVPVAAAIVLFARTTARRLSADVNGTGWWLRRGAVAGLIAIALQEASDFSLQMPANALLFTVLCAIAVHRRP